jgi:hypothetical protein
MASSFCRNWLAPGYFCALPSLVTTPPIGSSRTSKNRRNRNDFGAAPLIQTPEA